MNEALLVRSSTSDQGTFGTITVNGLMLYTAELPWRDNKTGVSCVPPDSYLCEYWSSAKYKKAYHLIGVPNRSAILIHQGNFAGDTAKGYKSNVLGCILVGLSIGTIGNQKAVLSSILALDKLINVIGKNNFILNIREAYGN